MQIYSRKLERLTIQFPELADQIRSLIRPDVQNFIIDTELVAIDEATNKYLPFQILS